MSTTRARGVSVEVEFPCDLDAERAVLGACLVRQDAIDELEDLVRCEDFYRDPHQRIFAALRRLRARDEARDLVSLSAELGSELEACGGPAAVSALVDGLPPSTHVATHAERVRDLACRRRFIAAALRGVERAAGDASSQEVLDEHLRAVLAIEQRDASRWVPAPDLAQEFLARMSRAAGGPMHRGLPTGFADLDEALFGWHGADLIYVAARPSMGKTALLLQFALAAAQTGARVGFLSLEMNHASLTDRLVSQLAPVDGSRLRAGSLSAAEYARISEAISRFERLPIAIDDDSSVTVERVVAKARRLRQQQGLDVLLLDYLQRLHETRAGRGERVAGTRTEAVGHQSRVLKSLAKELGIPIIVASQLSRRCEERADKRPQLSDLRESGDLEQDADVVLGLYRASQYTPEAVTGEDIAELTVLKQRNGPLCTIELAYLGGQTRFVSRS